MSRLRKGVSIFFLCDVAKLGYSSSFEKVSKHSKFSV